MLQGHVLQTFETAWLACTKVSKIAPLYFLALFLLDEKKIIDKKTCYEHLEFCSENIFIFT